MSDAAIASFAGRLCSLRPSSDGQVSVLTFAAGALYSSAQAVSLTHIQRVPDQSHWQDRYVQVSVQLERMASGALPETDQWLAGVYMNNALFRIDVTFERIARVVTGVW